MHSLLLDFSRCHLTFIASKYIPHYDDDSVRMGARATRARRWSETSGSDAPPQQPRDGDSHTRTAPFVLRFDAVGMRSRNGCAQRRAFTF